MKKKVSRWFAAGTPTGWRKEATQAQRRRTALASRHGKLLPTARALQALANVTTDAETRRKAHADAQYFYALYKAKQQRKK